MSHKKIHFKYLTLLIIVDLFGFLFAGCTEEGQSGNSETNSPVVDTQFGQVEAIEDVNSTWVWKAIPFAKPPVNNLRWKAPQDPDPWEEVRKETEFGSDCIQNANTPRGDEDCLYLNVWRPQNDDTKRPVFLYIHGGGNNVGSTNSSDIYGANLADAEDMVVVTSNYRLGPLGWFAHSSLRTGDSGNEYDDSGNFGTLDLVKALNWISKNIEAFGGDPENVTIAGQSAGCHNVLSLLISPEAENIFHHARELGFYTCIIG
ncbi:MAG: carboxylesterase/lipase family protein, partial [Proteobacteria bacterium]|nr:carboxylesterase/lipase family protein [Pseudomonadota bacterium]